MKLARYEIRMRFARKFDHFNELSVRRDAAYDQAFAFQNVAIFRIEFISMPVTFADLFGTMVHVTHNGTILQITIPRPKSHRAAKLVHAYQVTQFENDRERRFFVKLCRIGVTQSAHVAGEFDARRLHSKANTKVRGT